MSVCEYCMEDRDGYVSYLPKLKKGFNAFICYVGFFGKPHIRVSGKYYNDGAFEIKYCPMCGRKLVKEQMQ